MGGAKTAVVLLQMGGPRTQGDIGPFLTELFSDPAIIPLPGPQPLRRAIAGFLASRRTAKVADRYRAIGGGSPLVPTTLEQAAALEIVLASRGMSAPVRAVMRYCPPRATEVARELKALDVTRLVALSLYPHFSRTTTGSSLAELRQAAIALGLEVAAVDRWGDAPGYIALLAAWVGKEAASLAAEAAGEVRVLFSAHGLPERIIRAGDPYLDEVRRTTSLVAEAAGLPCSLSFQSRLGPVKWLGPGTGEVIAEFGRRGTKGLLLVPVSFVSDHIETLWDMDIVYREAARAAGITAYRRLRAFNADPGFVGFLADLVAPVFESAGKNLPWSSSSLAR